MENWGEVIRAVAHETIEAASDGTLDAFQPQQMLTFAAVQMQQHMADQGERPVDDSLDLYSLLVGASVALAFQTLAASDDDG